MDSNEIYFDPLTLNLAGLTSQLLAQIPPSSIQHRLNAALASLPTTRKPLLDVLSELLAEPACTLIIAKLFRPILLDLAARWIDGLESEARREDREKQLEALGLLIEVHTELYPILYRFLASPTFKHGPLNILTTHPALITRERLHRLLLATFRILNINRELPSLLLWDLTPLSRIIWFGYADASVNASASGDALLPSEAVDSGARLLAIRCYAYQSGMGEVEREKIEREIFGEIYGPECRLEYGEVVVFESGSPEIKKKGVDGWILPVFEVERIRDARTDIQNAPIRELYYTNQEGQQLQFIQEHELSSAIVNVHGILHLRDAPLDHNTQLIDSDLIETPTTIHALQDLALHLSLRAPTLITSPPSSGKSLLISHLYSLLHPIPASQPPLANPIITIHLSDTSLDARSLLGAYTSSTRTPGQFEFKDGILVRAMKQGRWVVLEDIDKASSEVLGMVVKPLAESMRKDGDGWVGQRASLDQLGRGRVVAHDNFRLFATRSVPEGRVHDPNFLGSNKWCEVRVGKPQRDEVELITQKKFAKLGRETVRSVVQLWEDVKSIPNLGANATEIGLRDLERFCRRLERILPLNASHAGEDAMDVDMDSAENLPISLLGSLFTNPALQEEIYLSSREVFFPFYLLNSTSPPLPAASSSQQLYYKAVADLIARHLNLAEDRRDWTLSGKVPEFDIDKDLSASGGGRVRGVRVGRTYLPSIPSKTSLSSRPTEKRPFALHKPALTLVSRLATSITLSEPLLLTGETGTGKTSVITYLSSLLSVPLISLNLSHQTEASDLIGGMKPVDIRVRAAEVQDSWRVLFKSSFSQGKNEKFVGEVEDGVRLAKWKRVAGLWRESARRGIERCRERQRKREEEEQGSAEVPRKRRKVHGDDTQGKDRVTEQDWENFVREVDEFDVQHIQGKGKFAFAFVEGPLVRALRNGDWVLLDEINLASPETLECISSLLQSPTSSITLTEQTSSLTPIPRHPNFRLFACMNPATDVGKKDLPPNIRSRFTEIYVPPPDADKETLISIVEGYLGPYAVGDRGAIMDVAEFYLGVKELEGKRELADGGSNKRPHFSMRTLARALTFVQDAVGSGFGFSLRRAIWEGCLMAFTMVLERERGSTEKVVKLAQKWLLNGVRNSKSLLSRDPPVPAGRRKEEFVKFGPFFLEKGPLYEGREGEEDLVEDYILTPSVERKLIDLARIVLTRRVPVLIEGPTSAGKTSSVEYLARRTGHRFIRINNHEHTDIQEYIGSYVSDPVTGKLVFKDGLLVKALRHGDWIVLDELNLAPTDVLEALNRLLDDNRELVIPETQEVVRPHPHFMLFATQNPPGLYAGRKVLSRAFRNRFLEVHFEDVPQDELETILCQRCRIAPSYGKKIVSVFHELQKRRQSTRVFESKEGFATLRDLFRWAGRDAVGYQELAENGYMLIAERARREDDKAVVKEVIENVMNVRINKAAMYEIHNRSPIDIQSYLDCPLPQISDIIWTNAMQRLFTLISRALKFNEPILLVGETGCGKTSVCQVFANARGQTLRTLNCHQNTETADLIGGLRPVRNRGAREAELLQEAREAFATLGLDVVPTSVEDVTSYIASLFEEGGLSEDNLRIIEGIQGKAVQIRSIFEWHDGPLVEAMRSGDVFLLDEISLADDSVLERLNSVLEPSRSIVLAEKGGANDLSDPTLKAQDSFRLISTMNPGGDYGKKELSPALRNRFTEIWVPRVDDRRDLELIVNSLWRNDKLRGYTSMVLDFTDWLCSRVGDHTLFSLRDILAWVSFTNSAYTPNDNQGIPADALFHHAAHMTFLDGLGSLPQLSAFTKDGLKGIKDDAVAKLSSLVPFNQDTLFNLTHNVASDECVRFGSFSISKGPKRVAEQVFNLQAPTTQDNAMRVIRACQVPKPILLEGSPGVGKTSLITAIANIAGHELCRINLSDQTDLIDLFGSDLPIEGGSPGEFAWKDAEFLKALQEGHWVLLDEMNLAPQAVLEGLNAVLDHRGSVFIPELGRTFIRHPDFRIFAAQNPLNQGGGRKGLPKSFVNRFTKVYVEELTPNDLLLVCRLIFPELEQGIVELMVSYNIHLQESVVRQRHFAKEGSPWEFNLRDIIRWGHLLRASDSSKHPINHLRTVYLHRFRNVEDQERARKLFDGVFATSGSPLPAPAFTLSPTHLQIGQCIIDRRNYASTSVTKRILKSQLPVLESLGYCLSQRWLAILTGHRNSGKTDVVRVLAQVTGHVLQEISINSATDTMDLLGSFEQVDAEGRGKALIIEALQILESASREVLGSKSHQGAITALKGAQQKPSLIRTALTTGANALEKLPLTSPESRFLGKVQSFLSSAALGGHFEWVDGPLVEAIKSGHWVLMDGANLCNPSVLDRLNSLCEHGGTLTLSERGYLDGTIQVLEPHPDFRLFMTVDPQHGELSRAMRNRGVEISILPTPAADDPCISLDHQRLPIVFNQYPGKSSTVTFEATRRAIDSGPSQASLIPKSTTGAILFQDSALSSLLDHAPAVASPQTTDTPSDAFIFFLGRTLSTNSLRPLARYLSDPISRYHTSHLATFLSFLDESVMSSLRDKLRETSVIKTSVPSNLTLAQPFDFYLSSPACIVECNLPENKVAHRSALQALDLATTLFLNGESQKHRSFPHRKSLQSLEDQIINVSTTFLSHLEASYHEVIDVLRSKGQANDVDLTLILSFGRYSQHLREVICNDSLDFSALQAICQLLNHLVENTETTPRNLGISFNALRDSLALKKGVGLFDIWSGTYINPKAGYITGRYDGIGEQHAPGVAQGLRRRALDFLALSTLPAEISQENVEKIQLLQQELEPASTELVQVSPNGAENPILIIAKLSLFPAVMVSPQLASETLQEIIKMSVHLGGSLSKVARLQHLVWQIEAGHNVIPTLLRSQLDWFEDLWQSGDISNSNPKGPSTLLMPCALASTLTTCDLSDRTLNNSPVVESDLLEHGRAVRLHAKQRNNRLHQLNDLFQLSLSMLANFFAESRRATQSLVQVREIAEVFAKSGRDEIGNTFARHFNNETPNLNSREGTIMSLAQVWVNLGKVVADLFIPDSPVDPLAVEDFVIQYRKQAHESLSHQIRHHLQLEKLTTGANTNGCIEYLEAQLGLIVDTLPSSNRNRYVHARDALRVRSFWSEVTQFRDQIIMSSKLSGLLESLLGGDSACISQEETIQHSMAGFIQRLNSIYGDLEDLVTPVKLSIHFLRLGLRLAAYYALLNGDDPAFSGSARTIIALTSYPTITSVSNLSKDGPLPGISPFRRVLLALSAINAERSISSLKETRLEAIERSYEQALRLWNIDLSKQAEADMAANSLYRKQKTDYEDVGEAELEEKEFLALFPSFEDVLDPPSSNGDASSQLRSTAYVTPIDMETLLQYHHQLLAEDRFPQAPTSDFLGIRTSILDNLVTSSLPSLSDELDSSSVHLQVWAIWKQVQFLRDNPTHSTSSYDFYRASNVPELQKAYTVVSALRTRLSTIIEDWPEQMVLHHLREKCDLILGLRLHSPVAKVLAALEQLLLQTEDWEMYANRDNTIKLNQNELIQLIVSWRRLELLSWQGLLDSQAQDYEKEVAPWWFRLYDATIRGPLAALADDNPDSSSQYLRTLVPLLSDFIQTSTLGQFRARMRLLHSFEDYVRLIRGHKDQSQQNLLLRIERIIESTRQAFDIFSSTIATHLVAERSKLEKEIRDFIKLASWKDVNVQALKASAQKTHHQLYKIVRKFRETLKQPASSLFGSPTTETTDTAPLPASSVSIDCDGTLISAHPPEVAEHFTKDLSRTINQFHQLVNSRIQVAIDSRRANLADDLAVNIIVTADDLAAVSVSGSLDGEARRKQQKALLVRKRKAWSDLLKELKRAGFTANVRPEVLHRNTDSLWLKDQPRLVNSLEPRLNNTRCEGYLYRLHAVLPQLRTSLSDHHSDISTRELKRGLMFVESVFSHGIELRTSLAGSLENYNTLSRAAKRLFALATTPLSPYCGPKLQNIVHSVYNALAQTSSALNDVLDVSEAYNGLKPEELIPAALIANIEMLKRSTITLRDQTLTFMDEFHAITQPFLTIDEERLVTASIEHLSNVSRKLWVISGEHPTLEFIFAPVFQWLDSQELDQLPSTNVDFPQETQTLDPLINGFLIIIQNVLSRCPSTDTTNAQEEQDDDQYLSRSIKMVGEITQALNMQSILSLLDNALPFLLSDSTTAQNKILAIKPFLDTYLSLVKAQLCSHLNWTTALFKLDFVLTSIMKRLAREGFCQPPENSDQGDEGDGGEATGGMGLGEGTGTENVSKEIEDESQVEGLKGEEGEKQDKDHTNRDEKGTIEMSEDIGGELEDVSEADEDEERESDDGSEADPEERIEDLDPKDPNAVDEKLWGDEKGPDDGGKEDEKLDQDRSEEKEGDSEVVAKDGEKKQSKEKQKPAKEKESEGDQGSEEDHTGADMEEDVEEPNANGAPMDEHLPDANTLDLPEDMDLGDEMKQDEDSLSGMDDDDNVDAMGEEEVEDIPELPGEQDNRQETWAQEDQPPELDPDAMDQDEGPDQIDPPKETADGQNDQEDDERNADENEATARPDISTGDGATANEDETDPTLGDSATSGQAGGTQDTSSQHNTGMETQPTEQQSSTQPLDQQAQDIEAQSSESQTAGAATSGAQEGQAPSQPETSIKTNPLRSLGDALNEVRQHFDDILSPEHRDRPKEQVGDVSNPSQLEYLQPDDADHDMQALGSAGEEQVAKLNELKLIDEEEQPGEAAPMDIDMPMGEENIQPPQPRETFRHEDLTAQDRRDDIEGAIQQSSNPATTQPSLSSAPEDFTRKVDPELLEEMEHAAEASLREWQSQGFPEAGGEKIWRTYESLTHDLAYALCEQLRLILEPTLATRLKGDYRTGKRLNMKKIISYIASDYTKDKIWLRRTRPSQREYQVLISIDDSRSMAESHSIHLAFETLALVSKALSRLEAGDIAIAKFGETVDILHGFDEGPFTDQAGTKVMNAFHFNQKATNVLSLVETSLKVLEKARERRATSSATAGDLWQLQFIISDGMCQDHEKLRTVLRKAEEQRVMIVFVILDSLHSTTGVASSATSDNKGAAQGSILTMDKAEFKNVGGRMELVLQKYLDSFPFEYYLVLRNVEALPEVLASTLKQFFERITEE